MKFKNRCKHLLENECFLKFRHEILYVPSVFKLNIVSLDLRPKISSLSGSGVEELRRALKAGLLGKGIC